MINFTSIRAPKLQTGKLYVAQIWATRNRRVAKLVRVREVVGGKINEGLTVVCDEFTATTNGPILTTLVDGKQLRVTFGTLVESTLLLPAPRASEVATNIVESAVERVKKARKPLTAEQKARKNELARARRAAAKEAV